MSEDLYSTNPNSEHALPACTGDHKNLLSYLKTSLDYIKEFGFEIYFFEIIKRRLNVSRKISNWIVSKTEKKIIKYLYANIVKNADFCRKIRNYRDMKVENVVNIPKIIWIMWWQGEKSAPDIVKICVSRIRKLNTNCEIRIIDKDNYSDYVVISEKIMTLVKKKKIGYANLADVIRSQILASWGGIWMDATLFITAPLDEAIFKRPFYSTRSATGQLFPSHGCWDSFFMTSFPNSPLFLFVNDFFYFWFEKYDFVIDYYLIDYAIKMAYELMPEIRVYIDDVPINNELCHSLCPILNQNFAKGKTYLNSDTTIFKLTYKNQFVESDNGIETVYGYIIKQL